MDFGHCFMDLLAKPDPKEPATIGDFDKLRDEVNRSILVAKVFTDLFRNSITKLTDNYEALRKESAWIRKLLEKKKRATPDDGKFYPD